MNKKFLSAILFGALMVTSTGTFVSCKDYDEDIDGLQTQVDSNKSAIAAVKGLETQVTALQAALSTAQSTADAAKKAAADAATSVEAAKKAAEAAAAQAKADAIAAAIKEANDLKAWVEAQGYLTKDDLAIINGQAAAVLELSAKVEAIEAGLSTLDTDIKQMYAGIQEQIELLTSTSVNNIVTLQEELALQQATLDNYEALLKELQAGDEELWAEIALARQELAGAISSLNIQLEEKTDDLWNEVALAKQELYGAISALTNIQADDKKALEEEIASVNKTLSETLSALITIQGEDKKALEEEIASVNKTLSETLSALANIQADDKKALEEEIALVNKTLSEAFSALNNSLNDKVDELWEDLTTAKGELYGAISAVNNLVNDLDGKLNTLTTLFNKRIASLTFIPKTFYNGVEAMKMHTYAYNALTVKDKDSEKEKWAGQGEAVHVNPVVLAQYHVSPATATFDELKDKLDFAIVENASVVSRGEASKDFNVEPEFVSLENGILTVKVNIEGLPAIGDKLSVIALKVEQEGGAVVTSDYAGIFYEKLNDLAIVDIEKWNAEKPVDYHFNTAIGKVWPQTATIDLELNYKGSLNLYEVVGVHSLAKTCEAADLEYLGMNLEFDVVANYILGSNETDQADFVKLEDGILTAKVFDQTGAAALDRTPIVRARLMHGENVVKVAYIKVKIVKESAPVVNKTIDMTFDAFEFTCDAAQVQMTTVKSINTQLYNVIGVSKEIFHSTYSVFDNTVDTEGIGEVALVEDKQNNGAETTWLLKWTLDNETLWENAGKEVSHIVYFRKAAGSDQYVAVKLVSSVKDVTKAYDLAKSSFITEYWNDTKEWTMFNVAVPEVGEENADKCTFENNLNAPFTTWANNSTEGLAGLLALHKDVYKVEYFFHESVEEIEKIGDIEVIFTTDGTTLYAQKDATATPVEIAVIKNNGTTNTTWNTVEYKNTELALELLNTGAMYTNICAKGYMCKNFNREVEISFAGEEYFKANFIRPIKVAAEAAGEFVDAVDYGEEGSFIRLEDLINPSDWRGREFANYENYWGYYGVSKITVNVDDAEANLNGGTFAPVPVTVKLQQPAGVKKIGNVESDYGFLTYKNNGNPVTSDFKVRVKVEVTYKWGEISTEWIYIDVLKTAKK